MNRRAIEAGFDGVELHGAHGFLLQNFFSPYFNRRNDYWGGSLEKRMRFPLAVVDAARKVIAETAERPFVLGYRITLDEPNQGGLRIGDSLGLVDRLIEARIDYLHVSLGNALGAKPIGEGPRREGGGQHGGGRGDGKVRQGLAGLRRADGHRRPRDVRRRREAQASKAYKALALAAAKIAGVERRDAMLALARGSAYWPGATALADDDRKYALQIASVLADLQGPLDAVIQRTQLINALRGHLAEIGLIAAQGPKFARELAARIVTGDDGFAAACVRGADATCAAARMSRR